MPTIPNGLSPIIDGYTMGSPEGVIRTPVAGGMSRYRLDWDRGLQPHQVTMVLDDVELSAWSAFFHRTIKNGALAFDLPLDSGFGTQTHEGLMVPGSYSVAWEAGDKARVSFVVRAESAAYALSGAAAQDLVDAFNAANPGRTLLERLRPMVRNYGYAGPEGVHTSGVDGGLPANAAWTERSSQAFQVTLWLTVAEFEVWTVYFLRIVKKGSISFPMYLDSGMGAAQHTVNIMPGTYVATRASGGRWLVSFDVEAESAVFDMSAAEADLLVELFNAYGPDAGDLLDRLAQFANEDTLVLQ